MLSRQPGQRHLTFQKLTDLLMRGGLWFQDSGDSLVQLFITQRPEHKIIRYFRDHAQKIPVGELRKDRDKRDVNGIFAKPIEE